MNTYILTGQICLIAATALIALRMGSHALVAYIASMALCANIFVFKQITLFELTATASDAYMIGSILGLNLLQEYYGLTHARSAIAISFFVSLLFLACSQLHLLFVASPWDQTQSAYELLFGYTPRIIGASLITYLLVQLLDAWLYAWAKKKAEGRLYLLRNLCTMACSQACDTILFSFLGLYGLVANIWHIIAISYSIKLVVITLTTPWLALSRMLICPRGKTPQQGGK